MATISPLDEIEWYDPHLIPTLGMGPQLNTNNILWYFANSPYFDHSSNNSALVQHAASAPNRDAIFFNRHNFETELRERFPTGRQFVVVSEPKAEGEPWVIQKQNKSYDKDKNIVVEAEATYYTIGTSIFKAPSLGDVMKSRLLTVSNLMQDFFTTSESLYSWTPATGHTYMPPTLQSAKATTSRIGSRAGSVAPEAIDVSHLTNTSTQPTDTSQTTEFSDDLFLQSLMNTNRFGHEFMDENPLQGEPGSFVYASTKEQVEARNKAQAAAQATGATLALPVKPLEGESAVSSVAPTPKPLPADSRKGSVISVPGKTKEKRRKSKGLASGQTSPTGDKS